MKIVVVGIISKKNKEGKDKYLLVSSKKDFGKFTGYYYPPGGHVEKDENEVSCLKREIKEELGLEVTSCEKVAETPGDVSDQITSWYTCKVKTHILTLNSEELKDANYFSEEDIVEMNIWPSTKKFFEKYIFKK